MKIEPTRNVISSWVNQPVESKNFESCPYNSPSLSMTDKRLSSQQIDQQNYGQGIMPQSTFSSNTEQQSPSRHEKRHYNSSPQEDRNSHNNPNNYYSADVQHYPSLGSAGKADFPDRERTPSKASQATESLEKGDQEWTLRSKEYDDRKKSSSSSLQKKSQEDETVHQNRRSSKNSEPRSAKKLRDVETQYSDKDGPYLNKDKNSEKNSRKSHSRKLSETNSVEKSLRRDSQSRSKREYSKRERSEEPNRDGSRSSLPKVSGSEKSSHSKSQHSLSKKASRTPSIANNSEEYISDNNRSMRGKEVEYQWEEQSDDQSAKKSRNSKSRSKRESSKREKSEESNRDGNRSSLKKRLDKDRSSNSKSHYSLSKQARTPSIASNTEEHISDNNRSIRVECQEQSDDQSAKKSGNSNKSRASKIHSPSQSALNEGSKRNNSQSRQRNSQSGACENLFDNQSKSAAAKNKTHTQQEFDYETDSKNGSLFFNESFGMPSEIERNNKIPSKAKTTLSDGLSDEDKLNKNRGYSSETPNYKKSSASSKNKSEYCEGAHQTNTLVDQILKGADNNDKITNRRSSKTNHNTSMSSQNKSLRDDKTPTFAQSEPEFKRDSNYQEAERDTRQAKSEILDRNRESRNREKIQSVLAKGREKSKQRDSQETIQNSLHKEKRTESPNNNISSSEISAQSDNLNKTPERPKRSKNNMQEYLSSNSKATVEEGHRKYRENKPKPKYDFKSDGLFSSDSPKPVESDFDSPGSNSIYSRNQQNSSKHYATAPKEDFISSDSPDQKASYKSSSPNNKIIESDLDSRQKAERDDESKKEIMSSKNSVSPSRKKSKHKEEISSHSDRKSKKSASALKTDTISSCDSFLREEEAIKKSSEEEYLSQISHDKNSNKGKSLSNITEEAIMCQKELFEKKSKRVIETSEKEIQTQRSQESEEKKGVYGEKLKWDDLRTAYKIQEQVNKHFSFSNLIITQ